MNILGLCIKVSVSFPVQRCRQKQEGSRERSQHVLLHRGCHRPVCVIHHQPVCCVCVRRGPSQRHQSATGMSQYSLFICLLFWLFSMPRQYSSTPSLKKKNKFETDYFSYFTFFALDLFSKVCTVFLHLMIFHKS